MEDAEAAVNEELIKLQQDGISQRELDKVKNKTESMIAFEDMSITNRAASLAMYELMGDADLINKELDRYRAVTADEIKNESNIIFDEKNSNTLYYYSDN
jgi:predicted Zn-dependent peptidase